MRYRAIFVTTTRVNMYSKEYKSAKRAQADCDTILKELQPYVLITGHVQTIPIKSERGV